MYMNSNILMQLASCSALQMLFIATNTHMNACTLVRTYGLCTKHEVFYLHSEEQRCHIKDKVK